MNSDFSRRKFLQATGLAGSLIATRSILLETPAFALPTNVGPNDHIRFGIIGVGMQGQGLLRGAVALPGLECVGACDLYDGRHTLAKEIAGANLPTTRRYQDLLNDKRVDALIIAVPDFWHRKLVVEAVNAGKDVYCEKPMSHNVADGFAMVDAVKKTGRIMQVGSQRTSSSVYKKAQELYQQGAIGDLLLIELYQGRNEPSGAWEYPPPLDLSPSNLDWDTWLSDTPKRPFNPEVFARWRCWKEYGTGVAGDLMVHLLSGMQFITGINQTPTRATAIGGIFRWKDGRDMPDVHTVLFNYGETPVYVRLTLGTETPEAIRLMGSKGILEVSGGTITHIPQTGRDSSPSYYSLSFPNAMRAEYTKEWHAKNDPPVGQELVNENVVYKGTDSTDDVKPHLWTFFECVRSRKVPPQDVVFGHHAAAACHMANESYFRKQTVYLDEASRTIKAV
ncbi:MAG TPA: Gfo/Idh/MocA family oxidoreductase [Terriglobales bacterium]|nr:Gfo/Idh/MocA family oxidoreductase [Terriglobales bacterium]